MTSPIGETIAHYRILAKLGEGGMGVVYKAEDLRLTRTVALKFLPHELAGHLPERARFLQEARAAATLNHPNVCTIYDIKEEGDQQFIVMEFVDGATLKERLPIRNSQEALAYALHIGAALHEAHDAGIVHRDIKSENIMVNSKNQVKVMDFGLAKLKGSLKLTKTSSTAGTLAYMAPELIQGGEADARSDIFSFGVVLFEMFAGHLPFRGEHEAAMMYSIMHDEPEQLQASRNDVPAGLDRIIRRALEKDPGKRYQHIDEMMSALRGAATPSTGTSLMAPVASPGRPSAWFRRALVGGAACALLVAGYLAYTSFSGKHQSIDSIAVLPFVNAGADAETEYLSDGITESLINTLSQLSNLTVMSRSSVFHFKGKDVDPAAAGKELGVRAVLLGRVTQRGDNLQISTELVDVSNNSHLWGEQYTRKMSDILNLQEDIARQISSNLRLRLSGDEMRKLAKRYTENTDAYQLYLKGNFLIQKATPEALAKGLELMDQAIRLDPNFPLPYLGRAYYNAIMTDFYAAPRDAMPKVRDDAARALELDEELSEAHNWLGMYYYWYEFDWSRAEKELLRSIQLNPNSHLGHQYYGWLLIARQRTDEAIRESRTAAELEPLSPEPQALYGLVLYDAHRYDESLAQLHRISELDPNYPFYSMFVGFNDIQKGKYAEALALLQKSHQLFEAPWSQARVAYAYAMSGQKREALAILDSLRVTSRTRYVASDIVATVYVAFGDNGKAIEYLEKAYEERAGWLIWLKVDPIWDPVRQDPRFEALLRRMGL